MASRFVIKGAGDEDSINERVAEFVCSMNPGMDLGASPYTVIGQFDAMGNIMGGCVFNNFTHTDVHIHVAGVSPKWLTRRFLGEAFRYVFQHLSCRRCTGLVSVSNDHALDFDRRLGFVHEGTIRKLWNDEDVHVLGMLREECRWLTVGVMKNGPKRTHEDRRPAVAALRQREPRPTRAVSRLDAGPSCGG